MLSGLKHCCNYICASGFTNKSNIHEQYNHIIDKFSHI